MTPTGTMSRSQLLSSIDTEYHAVDKIWGGVDNINPAEFGNEGNLKEVKGYISTAREALSKARSTMSQGGSN